jgi:hypothetical protein
MTQAGLRKLDPVRDLGDTPERGGRTPPHGCELCSAQLTALRKQTIRSMHDQQT